MQTAKQITRTVYPVDITEVEKELEFLAERLNTSKAEIIRDSIKYYAEYTSGLEVVEYRDISLEQAKREIKKYIKGKKSISADEISHALKIDMCLVNKALMELWQKEGWVEPYG